MPSDFTKFLGGFAGSRPFRGAGRALGGAIYERKRKEQEREQGEQERKQREQLAKLYGIEGSREGIAYITGQIDKIEDAFKAYQARTTQPEQPKPSELLKEQTDQRKLLQKSGYGGILPGIIGGWGKGRFAKEVEKPRRAPPSFIDVDPGGMSTLETLGILPPKKKVEKVKKEKTQEQLGEELYKRGQMMLSKIPKRNYLDDDEIEQTGRIPQTPQEHETYNLAKDYINRGLKMMGSEKTKEVDWWSSDEFQELEARPEGAGFVSDELSVKTQAYFKQGGWKTLEEFKASPQYQMLMENGTAEQIDQMEEDAEVYFGGGF